MLLPSRKAPKYQIDQVHLFESKSANPSEKSFSPSIFFTMLNTNRSVFYDNDIHLMRTFESYYFKKKYSLLWTK